MLNNQIDTARARFFMQAHQNFAKSEEEGRPIFEDREMISIQVPGDQKTEFVDFVYRIVKGQPVQNGAVFNDSNPNYIPPYVIRFAKEYEAFKAGQAQALTGTPLEHWPQMTASRVAELKAMKVLTVEDLSNVPDGILSRLGQNSRMEREKARAWLLAAKDSAVTEKQARENQELKDRIARLEALLAGAAAAVPEPVAPAGEIAIEDATDEQLKTWLKERGEPIKGNLSRATLEARVKELAA